MNGEEKKSYFAIVKLCEREQIYPYKCVCVCVRVFECVSGAHENEKKLNKIQE